MEYEERRTRERRTREREEKSKRRNIVVRGGQGKGD
jgi:hypothetical protein